MPTYSFPDWLHDLSEHERRALTAYKDESANLKAFLLEQKQDPALSSTGWLWKAEDVTAIDAAVARLKHQSPLKLWCAVADGRSVRSAIAGEVYEYRGYISVSKVETSAYSFFSSSIVYEPILLEFHMDHDFSAAQTPLREGVGDGENELILPRGRRYRIINQRNMPFAAARPHLVKFKDVTITILELNNIGRR